MLEALWQAGPDRGVVIAPPHPEYGGSLDNPVVSELAYAAHQVGYASLRFNWRGVGGSQGRISGDPGAAEADYRAALEHLAQTVPGPFVGAGYSFGAAAAVRVALHDTRLERLLLVAPPLGMLQALPLEDLARPLHVFVGAEDGFAPAAGLSERLAPLPATRLEVIPEADHFFMTGGLRDIARLAREVLA